MKPPRWSRRFWASTRGRIVTLLRRGAATVNDLAGALGLTDNAVRAHMSALERDGLVHAAGTRAGARRPNITYELTPEAEQLFQRAYGPLLDELLDVLGERLTARKVEATLREVGRRVAAKYGPPAPAPTVAERARQAAALLGTMGGLVEVERDDGTLALRSFGCPLAALVVGHPELCRMMESLLTEVVGAPVTQRCQSQPAPQCYFEIQGSGA